MNEQELKDLHLYMAQLNMTNFQELEDFAKKHNCLGDNDKLLEELKNACKENYNVQR